MFSVIKYFLTIEKNNYSNCKQHEKRYVSILQNRFLIKNVGLRFAIKNFMSHISHVASTVYFISDISVAVLEMKDN